MFDNEEDFIIAKDKLVDLISSFAARGFNHNQLEKSLDMLLRDKVLVPTSDGRKYMVFPSLFKVYTKPSDRIARTIIQKNMKKVETTGGTPSDSSASPAIIEKERVIQAVRGDL